MCARRINCAMSLCVCTSFLLFTVSTMREVFLWRLFVAVERQERLISITFYYGKHPQTSHDGAYKRYESRRRKVFIFHKISSVPQHNANSFDGGAICHGCLAFFQRREVAHETTIKQNYRRFIKQIVEVGDESFTSHKVLMLR